MFNTIDALCDRYVASQKASDIDTLIAMHKSAVGAEKNYLSGKLFLLDSPVAHDYMMGFLRDALDNLADKYRQEREMQERLAA